MEDSYLCLFLGISIKHRPPDGDQSREAPQQLDCNALAKESLASQLRIFSVFGEHVCCPGAGVRGSRVREEGSSCCSAGNSDRRGRECGLRTVLQPGLGVQPTRIGGGGQRKGCTHTHTPQDRTPKEPKQGCRRWTPQALQSHGSRLGTRTGETTANGVICFCRGFSISKPKWNRGPPNVTMNWLRES